MKLRTQLFPALQQSTSASFSTSPTEDNAVLFHPSSPVTRDNNRFRYHQRYRKFENTAIDFLKRFTNSPRGGNTHCNGLSRPPSPIKPARLVPRPSAPVANEKMLPMVKPLEEVNMKTRLKGRAEEEEVRVCYDSDDSDDYGMGSWGRNRGWRKRRSFMRWRDAEGMRKERWSWNPCRWVPKSEIGSATSDEEEMDGMIERKEEFRILPQRYHNREHLMRQTVKQHLLASSSSLSSSSSSSSSTSSSSSSYGYMSSDIDHFSRSATITTFSAATSETPSFSSPTPRERIPQQQHIWSRLDDITMIRPVCNSLLRFRTQQEQHFSPERHQRVRDLEQWLRECQKYHTIEELEEVFFGAEVMGGDDLDDHETEEGDEVVGIWEMVLEGYPEVDRDWLVNRRKTIGEVVGWRGERKREWWE